MVRDGATAPPHHEETVVLRPNPLGRPIYEFLEKTNFLNGINVICLVQSLLQKYSDLQKTQITFIPIPSRPTEGRSRSSRTRDGMRWTRGGTLTNVQLADGEVVWS
jgi:hypothetical protein